MRTAKKVELVTFPNVELQDNIKFDAVAEAGTFTFHFKWFNGRWNLWVTLPDGTIREAGVIPNILNWTGSQDYGLCFKTNLSEIDFSSLKLTEILIITWL